MATKDTILANQVADVEEVVPIGKVVETGGYDTDIGSSVITNPCQMEATNPIEALLYAVLCVFKRLLRVLKKHAKDIAMVVIGAMLGGSIVRFGRRMFRGITSIVRV
jgi:hypothetical protein